MERLPVGLFYMVIKHAVEDNPLKDTFGARLVNRVWDEVITEKLIRSPRLESEDGLNLASNLRHDKIQIDVNNPWESFPCGLKLLYLQHRFGHHETKPCNFSSWIHEMRPLAKTWNGDNDDEENWPEIQFKLFHTAASSEMGTRFLYYLSPDSSELAPVEYTDTTYFEAQFWYMPFEPLEKTFKIMLAHYAIHHGDTGDLIRLLKDGHDFTARSTRFRLSGLGENCTEEGAIRPEIVKILRKFGALFQQCDIPYLVTCSKTLL
ncbi:hypothetical protein BDW74DRAFT_183112 [Aspergillus multicolor]|uniref:uncharacterized protein n=1 Tax=Aspergillus multicolor TaxID=41759 RepID=UPI003CCCD67D